MLRLASTISLVASAFICGATIAHYKTQIDNKANKLILRQTLDDADDPIGVLIETLQIQQKSTAPQYVPAPKPATRSFIPDNKFDIQVKRRAITAGTLFDGNLDNAIICKCGGGEPVCFCYAPNK